MVTNEATISNNHVTVAGAPVFTWDPPQNEPKDPVISTPVTKAPIGITTRNSCQVQTETITTSARQQQTTSLPPLEVIQSQNQGVCCNKPTQRTTLREVEINGAIIPKETSRDHVQLSADDRRPESDKATICKPLGKKRPRTKPLHMTFCLPGDTKHGILKAEDIFGPANHERKQLSSSIVLNERLNTNECAGETMTASSVSRSLLSSTENKHVQEGNTVSFSHLVFIIN